MKTRASLLTLIFALLMTGPALGQFGAGFGGPPKGATLSGPLSKLFGDQPGFSATMEMQSAASPGETMTIPGKIAFLEGKSRFEMDLGQGRGSRMPPNAAAQMKTMGMDKMITIMRPDKKVSYVIIPGLKAYAETPLTDPEAAKSKDDFKIERTEITRETVEGHDCIKNKVLITDKENNKHEVTVWNATDLDKFPVKIEQNEGGTPSTITFKEIKLTKPDAALFEPPADFTKYNSYSDLVQKEMMKKFSNGQSPARPPSGGNP
jgi:hypothetical protein